MLPGRILVWCHVTLQVMFLPAEHFMEKAEVWSPDTISRTQSLRTEGSGDYNSTSQWWTCDSVCDVMLSEEEETGFEACWAMESRFEAYKPDYAQDNGAMSFELRTENEGRRRRM